MYFYGLISALERREHGEWGRGKTFLGSMVMSEERISVQRLERKEGAYLIEIRRKREEIAVVKTLRQAQGQSVGGATRRPT